MTRPNQAHAPFTSPASPVEMLEERIRDLERERDLLLEDRHILALWLCREWRVNFPEDFEALGGEEAARQTPGREDKAIERAVSFAKCKRV